VDKSGQPDVMRYRRIVAQSIHGVPVDEQCDRPDGSPDQDDVTDDDDDPEPARLVGHMTEVEIDRTVTSRGRLSVPEAQEYLRAAQQRGFQGEASISEQSNRRASQSRFTDAMCVFRQRTLANSSVW